MNARDEQRERTHDGILASAARLVRARGIVATSVSDVMRGAGLTVGGFYAHFASKEALVSETLRRAAIAMRDRLLVGLEGRDVREQADVILKRYLSRTHRDEPEVGCPLPAVVSEVATTATEQQPALAEALSALASALEDHLPPTDGSSRRHVALATLALMFGGLSLARAVRGTPLSDEILRACRAFGRSALLRER